MSSAKKALESGSMRDRNYYPFFLRLSALLFFLFVAFFAASGSAQGWRLFSKKIKEDAQKAKEEKEESRADEGDDLPPLFDVSRKDREAEIPSEPSDEEDAEPVQRDVRAPVSNGGLLDFSSELVDDAAQTLGDAENLPVMREEPTFAPNLPSYRDFPQQKNDARLNDVLFQSPSLGWAVGDRGTIWRTTNGGERWELVETPTDANLFAVSFLDENFGLAVGGRILPTTRVGQGVVLRTIDGGQTWGEVETASFPVLRDVKIVDEEMAWIAGDSSNLYPSGLFYSADSGLEWAPVEGNKREGWRSVLYDPLERLGVGATVGGAAQSVDGTSAERIPLSIGARRLTDVAHDGSTNETWLVGDRGLVLVSTDFGANWSPAPGGLPGNSQNYFDFKAAVARDGFVGAVGSPGSLFFYSDDGGAVWNVSRTGVSTPLRKLFFLDRNVGWAVGDLGVVVATSDGGRTWRLQRSGGSRAALLGVFGRVGDVPLEALVQLAGDEGRISEIAIVARELEALGKAEEIPIEERFAEALVETGADGAEFASLFSLEPEARRDSIEQILRRFDAENDGDGLARFREALVRLIRVWRPSVLLTADSALDVDDSDAVQIPNDLPPGALVDALAADSSRLDARPRDPFQELLLRELPGAIQKAADPTEYPEHITLCGLEPWSVKKARATCRGKTQGNSIVDSSYFCSTLGRPVAEIAASARGILDSSPVRDVVNFQTLFCAVPTKLGDKTFFDGLEEPYGSEARRARQTGLLERSEQLAARAGDRRQKLGIVASLSRRDALDRRGGDFLLSQLRENVKGVDRDFALEYLTTVGRQFASSGNLTAAEEAYSLAALLAPDDPKANEALVWLARYYCGSEPARRVELQGGAPLDEAEGARYLNARRLGDALREVAPESFMAPEFRFPLAVAQSKSGDLDGAMRFYLARSQASEDDVWGVRAAAEYWLRAPQNDMRSVDKLYCPLASFSCARIPEKPYLDGAFEPRIWDGIPKLKLSTPFQEAPPAREPTAAERSVKRWREKNKAFSTDLGTEVALARDADFLYIAATCPKSPNRVAEPESSSGSGEDAPPRKRDPYLELSDRLEFEFDLDGDYATTYRFVFDAKGRVFDSNWGDASWNPEIYVASTETPASWTIEAAIAIKDLCDHSPNSGEVWRAAISRVEPGVGIERWNVENSDSGENAFGLMNFE